MHIPYIEEDRPMLVEGIERNRPRAHRLDDDRRGTDEAFEVVIRQSAQASDEAHLLMRV